jgi:hypothetical protein
MSSKRGEDDVHGNHIVPLKLLGVGFLPNQMTEKYKLSAKFIELFYATLYKFNITVQAVTDCGVGGGDGAGYNTCFV